jgi:hypothetical protein
LVAEAVQVAVPDHQLALAHQAGVQRGVGNSTAIRVATAVPVVTSAE